MFDSKQAILNLRGTFLLPELETQGFLRRFGYGDIAHVVPIDENHLIVHTDISIFLYTLSTQEKLWEIDCPSFNFAIDISHGIVVLIPEDKIVTLWNMHTGELLHQFIYRNENSEKAAYRVNPNGLELSYDGNILAVGMQNNHESVVTLWNTTNGHLVRVLALGNHLNDITTLAFHPDGNILAGGSFNNHKVWFWSLDDGSLLNVWDLELSENNHRDRPYDLAFSYDGTRLFVGSGTCGLRVWDVKQKQEITCPLSVADVQPTWLAVDPSGHFLALVHSPGIQNQMLHILDIENWRTVYTFSGEFSCPSFSLDGRLLAVGPARRGPVHFINVATGQELAQFQLRDFLGASLALPYPSKNILAEARNDQIRLWDTHDNSLLYDLQFPPLEKGSTVSIAFNPQRPLLAVSRRFGFKQFFIDLWDVSDGTFLFHLEGHTGSVLVLAFSPNGRILASGSADKTLRFWDLERKQEICRCEGHTLAITSIAFAPDSSVIASGSLDKTLRLWSVGNGDRLCELTGHTGEVLAVTFSPDGQVLASGDKEGKICIWSVTEQKQIEYLIGHKAAVNSLTFHSNGHFLVSGSDDQTVRLWDTIGKRTFFYLKPYQGQIKHVMFTADGKTLITSAIDCVRFWRTSTLLGKIGS